MASVFKRKASKFWHVSWTDHTGKRCFKSTQTTDKQAAQRIANKHEADAALRRDGVIDTRAESMQLESSRPVREILGQYEANFRSSDKTLQHIEATRNKIERVITDRQWEALKDFDAAGLNAFCSALKADGRSPRTIGGTFKQSRD